ncbi:MAG: response regulator [Oscillospiraceae bacterium]|jgi:signal transduction histidine kinase/DNA-binding response OmpR family regulator/HPt (histidine-containing phosphotransfer) domain-containing protein|nr:response regulator [Oscillospiraceae bacterium]
MSIRVKTVLSIVIIAVVIIVFGIGSGLFFVRANLEKTIVNDMNAVAAIADELATTAINLLKADASVVVRHLYETSEDDFHEVLRDQTEAYNNFIALTVFDRNGIVDSCAIPDENNIPGIAPAPAEFLNSEYVQRAFYGETVISTTYMNVTDSNERLVFYLVTPLDNRVLCATIPGMYFSDLLSDIKIWQTGNIFVLDAVGTIVADTDRDLVIQRYNSIERAKTDAGYEDIAGTAAQMISGEAGTGRYYMYGKERLCIYTPITGSKVGWSLGVVAPIEESPLQNVRDGLLIVGAVCLLLSVVAANIAVGSIVKPYKEITAMTGQIESRDRLLHTINDAAALLLRTETGSFESDIWNSMDMIARVAGVDRMRVWQNNTANGELFCSQRYEWSGGAEPQAGKPITKDISYSKTLIGWEGNLSHGHPISGFVRDFSPLEQAVLVPQGIISILVVPVFFRDSFWGFIAFDDCHTERVFSEDDESLLSSGGMLIANAILRNDMTHQLVLAREEAIAGAEAKTDFLANMSHEMRTPLNAIIGLSELTLDSGEVEGYARENLEKVYNSGVTLLSLINDILDISKIDSGKFELIPVEYDTPSLINDTVTLNIVRIGSKPITFDLHIDGNVPSMLVGDELRLKQIFNNLLSNAFKYTKEGSVVWSIDFEEDGDDVWIVSSIRDSGIGIRPKDMEKLFTNYNQVDTKSNRKIEGTGLGLSICKSLLDLMDGSISVESEYGEGSVFSIRVRQGKAAGSVPIGDDVANNLRSFRYSEHKRDRSSKLVRARIPYAKVLVVDDVPTNLDVARGMMKPYGMQVDCAASGPAAIELIRNSDVKYNAIFMDHMMPEMDGIEATRIIRQEIGTDYARNIPIIALTANAIVGNEDMFLKNGFQAFLSKPIDIMRMDVVINHWVRDREYEKKYAAEISSVGIAQDRRESNDRRSNEERRKEHDRRCVPDRRAGITGKNISGLDIVQGKKRFGDDEEVYLDVLKSYALNTPQLLDKIRSVEESELADYAVIVHGLKSSSRSIGAEAIGARAESLEFAAKAGDFEIVNANNDSFVEAVQSLIAELSVLLGDIAKANPKPSAAKPDADTLAALRDACTAYDIDAVDAAMRELEKYDYKSGGDLVDWLQAQISIMGFKQIVEKLSNAE